MMNNIKCLDYESNWGLSMFRYDQFQDAYWKNPQIFFIIVISICFSYSKCLRVIELEADENHSNFWMRQALPWPWHGGEVESPAVERGPDQCSLGDPTTPPLNVILRGPHSKISAMGPEFLTTDTNHGFRPIHSLSPCIYPHTPLSLL